jgi:hypothetical protein
MSVKNQVAEVLDRSQPARDEDRILISEFYRKWHPEFIHNGCWVNVDNIVKLTSPETITRIRRKFQEEGKYEASPEVKLKRKGREEKVGEHIVTPHWAESFE